MWTISPDVLRHPQSTIIMTLRDLIIIIIILARKSTHSFASLKDEADSLIYNYNPIFTGDVSKSFLQSYFFN